MIRLLSGLPSNVVGFEGVGEVHSDDYKTVLFPAIEQALKAYDKIRLLHVLPNGFEGYSPGTRFADAKVGLDIRRLEKIAVVTDLDWIAHAVKALGWMIPGALRVHPIADQSEAEAWVAA